MTEDNIGKRLLENAYKLDTPNDNENYYNKLADYYDREFAVDLGYSLPRMVAARYLELATAADAPIADIGCGTGLIGAELAEHKLILDGMDISSEMLTIAREKSTYRSLIKIDLVTDSLDELNDQYGAVLSSGTFTHGHLGPDALVSLLNIAKKNALFVITINAKHYSEKGFEATINQLLENKLVRDLEKLEVEIYQNSEHEHAADLGLLVSFRKSAS